MQVNESVSQSMQTVTEFTPPYRSWVGDDRGFGARGHLLQPHPRLDPLLHLRLLHQRPALGTLRQRLQLHR